MVESPWALLDSMYSMPSAAAMARSRGRGDEPADQLGAGAHIDGRDRDRRIFAAGILPNVDRTDRLQAGNNDQKTDHQREDRPADEDIGKCSHSAKLCKTNLKKVKAGHPATFPNQLFSGLGSIWNSGERVLSTTTD